MSSCTYGAFASSIFRHDHDTTLFAVERRILLSLVSFAHIAGFSYCRRVSHGGSTTVNTLLDAFGYPSFLQRSDGRLEIEDHLVSLLPGGNIG